MSASPKSMEQEKMASLTQRSKAQEQKKQVPEPEETEVLDELVPTPAAEAAGRQEIPASWEWRDVVWYNVIVLALWHLGALYALVGVMPYCSWKQLAVLWLFFWHISGLGITAGAHRLWAHRSYKAKWPLRVFLMLCNSMAFEGSIYEWARDHRVHHKSSDTNGDPHNATRGFFFAHVGWVMVRKHPNVFASGKKLNFDDLRNDPVVHFQMKYYLLTVLCTCYLIPTYTGHLMGSAWAGFWVGGIFRHVWVLHATWCVNSVAHFFGYKPYDRNIRPVENIFVSLGAIGEGYHNYHHKYPSDYATSEYGITSGQWNPTKLFIDACAAVGLATDMKRSRTAAATRERLAIRVHEEQLKNGVRQLSTFDRLVGRFFFGRSEEHLF